MLSSLFKLNAGALLCMMIFAPGTWQYPKAALILLMILSYIVVIYRDDLLFGNLEKPLFRLDAKIIITVVSVCLCGLFFVLRGVFFGNVGAMYSFGTYVIWPVFYLFMVGVVSTPKKLEFVFRVIEFAYVLIIIYSVQFFLHYFGLIGDFLPSLFRDGGFDVVGGALTFNIMPTNSLGFLSPFFCAMFILYHKDDMFLSKGILYVALAACSSVLFVILSGRRAFILATFLSSMIALFLGWFLRKDKHNNNIVGLFFIKLLIALVLVVVSAVLLLFMFNFNFSGLFHRFLDVFDPGRMLFSITAVAHHLQMQALWNGFLVHPILGNGFGYVAHYIRSLQQPWAYELTYMDLLASTGVVGGAVYLCAIIALFWVAIKLLVRSGSSIDRMTLVVLVALFSMLLANSVDPYLNKFDGLWMIFLPIAMINAYMVDARAFHNE